MHLYGLLHQLAFLAGKVKDAEDMAHLIDTAKRYGEIADEKFDGWDIPGRYMVFGDKADLTELYRHSPSVQPFSGGEASQAMSRAPADRRRGETPVEPHQRPSVFCLFRFHFGNMKGDFYAR